MPEAERRTQPGLGPAIGGLVWDQNMTGAAELVEACVDGVCGVRLHKCQRCGFESGWAVHTSSCPGCLYRAEVAAAQAEGELLPNPPYAPGPADTRPPGPPHVYPSPRPHRGRPITPPPQLWTIGDALDELHPRPNRRTLARWLTRLTPVGERCLPQGGPPARLYREADVRKQHSAWTERLAEKFWP